MCSSCFPFRSLSTRLQPFYFRIRVDSPRQLPSLVVVRWTESVGREERVEMDFFLLQSGEAINILMMRNLSNLVGSWEGWGLSEESPL
jgi:hypothetical protein